MRHKVSAIKSRDYFFCACFLMMVVLCSCSNLPDMETARRAAEAEDYQTAQAHYEQLSEFGLPEAKIELGKMYLYGRGVESDPEKSLSLFEEAKNDGETRLSSRFIPRSQAKLGVMALKGETDLTPQQGLQMLQQAAATGDASAMFNLGFAYQKGLGVPPDGRTAEQYYRQAAAMNYPRADFYRGQMYQRGELIPKDMDTALRLYESAAQNGYPRAYIELGKIYEKGEDLPQNYEKAKNYYALAKEKGLPADKDLERVQSKSG